MDRIDLEILDCVQHDASLSTSQIAKKVNLSTTPCWRRIRRLEDENIIQAKVGLLSRDRLNLGIDVFVAIRTDQHNAAWLTKFANAVTEFPQVMEFYRMSGDIDYLMRVVVSSIDAFDHFYKRLISAVDIHDVSSSFAMERIKYTTALPLQYALPN